MYNYSIMPKRLILCVDLKSFYASCSALSLGLDPLKHKLAVVGNTEREGSIVLAATPPLKALGIKQGSRLYEVPRRKDIHIVNPSIAHYIKVSNHISSILLRYVPIEDFHAYSIDEALIDVTHSLHLFAKSPAELATKIIENIKRETGIIKT
uniref:Y-family DNA polymerase n=1 Tax=Bacillus sp. OTU530 TaxID=3043862 RepID=UPI00313E0716